MKMKLSMKIIAKLFGDVKDFSYICNEATKKIA